MNTGMSMGVGIALGLAIGLMLDNLAIGVAIGVALGAMGEGWNRRQTSTGTNDSTTDINDEDSPPSHL